MSDATIPIHPAAIQHLPPFITRPGDTDVVFVATAMFLVFVLLMVGTLYLRLHSLPEQMAHRSDKVQLQIVAVLGLLALFTHNHLFWIAGLLLALVDLPNVSNPIASIAASLERMSGRDKPEAPPPPPPSPIVIEDRPQEKLDA